MSDPISDLETELRRFAPAVPPGDLAARVDHALQSTAPVARPWTDRCLLGALAMGLAAAVVIVALLGSDWSAAARPPAPRSLANTPTVVQTRELLIQLALGQEAPTPPSASAPN